MNPNIIREKDMFCFETAFSTILSYYEIPYQILFSSTWGGSYDEKFSSVGENIQIEDWKLLAKLKEAGIVEKKVPKEKIKDLQYICSLLEKNRMAIASLDISKYNEICGSSLEGKVSPILIYAYRDGFVAYDLHYTHKEILITNEVYQFTCIDISFYFLKDNKLNVHSRIEKSIKANIPCIPDFGKISLLAKKFSDGEVDLFRETKMIPEKGNPVYAPLINKIETLARGRNMFSIYLTYINSMVPEIDITDACEKMSYWAGRWNLVKVILIKAYFKKDYSQDVMKKIANIISDIAFGEKELYEQLVNVVPNVSKNEICKCMESVSGKKREIIPVTIDLSKLYNNSGIVISGQNKNADMTGLGAYIEYEEAQLLAKVSKCNDKYNILSIAQNALDNILCQEQEVNIPKGTYNRLNILGCSDYGSFSDYMTICYEDEEERVLLQFSSWINKQPLFNDKIYCTGKLQETNVRLHQSAGTLFTQSLDLKDKRIVAIKLPNCPAMHIFSIYLE